MLKHYRLLRIIILLTYIFASDYPSYSDESETFKQYVTDGDELLQEGDLQGAMKQYQEAVKIDPGNFDTHLKLGKIFEWSGNFSAAAEEYKHAIASSPKNAEAHFLLGYTYIKLRELNNAEKECKEAIKLNPKWAEPYLLLGNILEFQYRRKDAIPCYKEATLLEPNNAHAHLLLGTALYLEGDINGARRQLDVLKKLDKSKAKWLADMLHQ